MSLRWRLSGHDFHLGTLLSLNELGFLKKLARVSSVSGGSITAGVLRPAWKSYNIADYGLPDAMNCPFDETIKLAAVATIAFPCKNSPKNEERQSYPHRWSNSSPNGTVRSVKL
jgi:hypothetical protein